MAALSGLIITTVGQWTKFQQDTMTYAIKRSDAIVPYMKDGVITIPLPYGLSERKRVDFDLVHQDITINGSYHVQGDMDVQDAFDAIINLLAEPVAGGTFSGTLDDVPDGTTYVRMTADDYATFQTIKNAFTTTDTGAGV
jgi:hypothetical protein